MNGKLDYCLVQILNGHGNFRANLNGYRFRLVDCPECGWRDVYEADAVGMSQV